MTIDYRLKAHVKDLGGGFTIHRLLPAAAAQSVGPFIFFDHFGPIDALPDADHDVRPHPHIGLATVTYLYEGAMMHRDSVGSVQRIEPGAINLMIAGSGVVHSERTPEDMIGKPRRTHGLQLWIALPKEHEEVPASFSHTPAADIPEVGLPGGLARVLIGTAFGRTSPVATVSETLYLDIGLEAGGELLLTDLPEQAALYAVTGELTVDGEVLPSFTMAALDTDTDVRITTTTGVQFVVIGGAPIDGHRFMFWNFVSSSKERLDQASADWEMQRFAEVPGETEWIPLPPPMH